MNPEADLRAENFNLKELLKKSLERISSLEEELRRIKGQSSRNSSLPPSTDKPKLLSKNQIRRGGAVRGHQAHQYAILPQARIDRTENRYLDTCPSCGNHVISLDRQPTIFQHLDLVEGRCTVTHYLRSHYRCRQCRRNLCAPLPKGIAHSPFGPSLQAAVATLTSRYHLSKRDVCSLIKEFYNVHISCGAVCKIEANTAERLKPLYEQIRHAILCGHETTYVDETTWRHDRKRGYVWQVATKRLTLYRVEMERSRAAMNRLLGQRHILPTVTDRYSAYHSLEGPHQYCLAHLLRDFQSFADSQGWVGAIGRALKSELLSVMGHWKRYRADQLTYEKLRQCCAYRRMQIRHLLQDGFFHPNQRLNRFCRGLLQNFDRLWTFLRIPGMEPTNNQAERDLRPLVLWRKNSLGTKGKGGLAFVTVMGSIVQSLRKQGRSILSVVSISLRDALLGKPLSTVIS